MPSAPQKTIDIISTPASLGAVERLSTSDSAKIAGIFPGSPIHNGTMTRESILEDFKSRALNGTINDGGHTFGEFDTSYADAPDISSVTTGGGGLPASPHVPNPVSPGVGSINPNDQPAAPEGFGTTRSDIPGSGQGSSLDPAASSEAISGIDISDLSSGRAV